MIYSSLSYIIPIPENEDREGAIRNMVEAIYQLDPSVTVRDALLVRSDNPAIQGILDWLSRVRDGEDLDQLEGTVLRPESRLLENSYQVSMTHAGIEEFDMHETAETQSAQKGKKVSVVAECKSCGEVKKLKAKGLCGPCYARFGENYAPARQTAKAKSTTTEEPEAAKNQGKCVQCGREMRLVAKQLCSTCYDKTKNYRTRNPYHGTGGIPSREKLDQNIEKIVARVHEQQARAAQAARERAL